MGLYPSILIRTLKEYVLVDLQASMLRGGAKGSIAGGHAASQVLNDRWDFPKTGDPNLAP